MGAHPSEFVLRTHIFNSEIIYGNGVIAYVNLCSIAVSTCRIRGARRPAPSARCRERARAKCTEHDYFALFTATASEFIFGTLRPGEVALRAVHEMRNRWHAGSRGGGCLAANAKQSCSH